MQTYDEDELGEAEEYQEPQVVVAEFDDVVTVPRHAIQDDTLIDEQMRRKIDFQKRGIDPITMEGAPDEELSGWGDDNPQPKGVTIAEKPAFPYHVKKEEPIPPRAKSRPRYNLPEQTYKFIEEFKGTKSTLGKMYEAQGMSDQAIRKYENMIANRTQKSGATYLEYIPTPTQLNEAFTTQTPIQYNDYGTQKEYLSGARITKEPAQYQYYEPPEPPKQPIHVSSTQIARDQPYQGQNDYVYRRWGNRRYHRRHAYINTYRPVKRSSWFINRHPEYYTYYDHQNYGKYYK